MINGKNTDQVHYLTMLRSIQRMEEKEQLSYWKVCDQYQLLNDFVDFDGVIPAPVDSIVSHTPIKSWQSGKEYQWYCRIKDEASGKYVYFTEIRG